LNCLFHKNLSRKNRIETEKQKLKRVAKQKKNDSLKSNIETRSVAPKLGDVAFEGDTTAGGSAQSMCYASAGDSPITFYWTHNNQSIDLHDDISVFKAGPRSSILSIENLQAQHSGTYVCRAENAAGQAVSSVQLNIQGPTTILPIAHYHLFYHPHTVPYSSEPPRFSGTRSKRHLQVELTNGNLMGNNSIAVHQRFRVR